MDLVIERLLDKYDLLAYYEKFILAGITTLQDLAHINKDTLRSHYLMLDADINNFEKLRSECIVASKFSKRPTSTAPSLTSSSIVNLASHVSSGVGSSSIPSLSSLPLVSLDSGPSAMVQRQTSSLHDISDGIVYDSQSQFPIGTVSSVQGVLILTKFAEDETIANKISEHKTKIPKYDLDSHSCKGLGLIMVIDSFAGGLMRPGADDDIKKLKSLFTKMNLQVVVEDNFPSQQKVISSIKDKLICNQGLSSFFIAISSLGTSGDEILCADNQVISISDILAAIESIPNPDLIGKPKIILVESIWYQGDTTEKKKVSYQTSTKECDILVSNTYVSRFMYLRYSGTHSWFIASLCEAYNELIEEKTDFVSILTYANQIMLQKFYGKEECVRKQSIHLESTLTKLLIL